jgi:hypothetical protein
VRNLPGPNNRMQTEILHMCMICQEQANKRMEIEM